MTDVEIKVVEPPDVERLMVVAAHPDDLEAICGATVALAIDRGAEGCLVLTTSGDKGSRDPFIQPAELSLTREEEAVAGARELGINEVVFLRHRDGELENSLELRRQLVKEIRTWQPEAIFTFDPEHSANPYLNHRDHRTTGRATLDCVFPLARDPLNFPEQYVSGLKPHKVEQVWLFGSAIADSYVDVTDGIDRKIQARLHHHSQNANPDSIAENYRKRAEETGDLAGLPMAERFKVLYLRR